MTYRVGRHLGRTIYRVNGADDELIGMMDTPEDGALVVEALKARERVLAAGGTSEQSPRKDQLVRDTPLQRERDMSVPQSCQDSEGRPVESEFCEVNGPHYVTKLGVPHGLVRAGIIPRSQSLLLPDLSTCGRVGMHNCGVTGRYQSHDSGNSKVGGPAEGVPPSQSLLLPETSSHGTVNTRDETIGEHTARCQGCA